MPNMHVLKAEGVHLFAATALDEVPRHPCAGRTSWGVLTLLFLWTTAILAGCGQSPEQVKEERKEKQQVVQEKMKQFMMEKAQAKRSR
jgi:hypothetical protein